MGDNNNTVPNLSHLVSSGDSLSSQGKQQTKAQSASEHDVVDTFWDIPPITFSEVESAVERGEASDAAYAQVAATNMTTATSSTPVSDAPTVNLRVEDFPNIAGKHISGAENCFVCVSGSVSLFCGFYYAAFCGFPCLCFYCLHA